MPFSTRLNGKAWVMPLAAGLGLALYLTWSWAGGHVGFPLDDAWIHQTYARNLVAYGEWSFVPGRPSAGSTAPLWTLLLSIGYGLRLPFRVWTYLLGGLCLAGTALLAARLAHHLFPSSTGKLGLIVGVACALEWHLVWAAASGMETLLFALLGLALWNRAVKKGLPHPLLTGLLGGLLILTRPEGVLAVGLVAGGVTLAKMMKGQWRRGLAAGGLVALGTGLVVAPYLALNLHLSGTLWPNTFYAKQAEYAPLLAQPLLARLLGRVLPGPRFIPGVAVVPLIGGQVLLIPGLVWGMWRAARREEGGSGSRRVTWWLPLAWAAATVGVYGLRLPVIYQHGRYLIPIIPILLVYGIGGTQKLIAHRRTPYLIGRVLLLSTGILFGIFFLLGAQAYQTDVAIIEEEMVDVARWLNENTPPDALIAAHDIGAIGYFAQRPLIDLAALVSPEVTPFIRDEERLLRWMEEKGADYIVTFPSWYPTLTADPRLEVVYRTDAAVTVEEGGENMVVYSPNW